LGIIAITGSMSGWNSGDSSLSAWRGAAQQSSRARA
jgi:hypothetical protein